MRNPWKQNKCLTWFLLPEVFDLLIRQELIFCCHAGQMRGGLSPEPTLPATTWSIFCTLSRPALGSSLASWPPLVSLTTISMFVLSDTLSIKVKSSSTSLIYSCSSNVTSLLAIALTRSIRLLYTTDLCPVWGYLFNPGLYPTTVTTLWQNSGL